MNKLRHLINLSNSIWTTILISIVIFLVALLIGQYSRMDSSFISGLLVILGTILGAGITATARYINSNLDRNHQLRLAALDRRLAAHQEAYALWRKLCKNLDGDNTDDIIRECLRWWDNNCLYLEEKARRAFSDAYKSAYAYKDFVRKKDSKYIFDARLKVESAGAAIEEGVLLPPISEPDIKTNGNKEE